MLKMPFLAYEIDFFGALIEKLNQLHYLVVWGFVIRIALSLFNENSH